MSERDKNPERKRGRPAIGRGVQVNAMLRPEAVAAIDDWILRQAAPQPSRPEAMRQLVDLGLAAVQPAEDANDGANRDQPRAKTARATLDAPDDIKTPDDMKMRRRKAASPPATETIRKPK